MALTDFIYKVMNSKKEHLLNINIIYQYKCLPVLLSWLYTDYIYFQSDSEKKTPQVLKKKTNKKNHHLSSRHVSFKYAFNRSHFLTYHEFNWFCFRSPEFFCCNSFPALLGSHWSLSVGLKAELRLCQKSRRQTKCTLSESRQMRAAETLFVRQEVQQEGRNQTQEANMCWFMRKHMCRKPCCSGIWKEKKKNTIYRKRQWIIKWATCFSQQKPGETATENEGERLEKEKHILI